MTATAKFISLEGIEGAGKSTLARSLEAALRERGLRVRADARAGRHAAGRAAAQPWCWSAAAERISAAAETLLMFAARAIHLENLIRRRCRREAG